MSEVEIIHQNIQNRRSVGILVEPAPNREQLDIAFSAAWVAPDHRRLKPTRFVVVEQHQRTAFAEVMAQAHQDQTGELDNEQLEKIRQQVMRAPMLIIALTELKEHEKVPYFEQILSTGAAVQNLLLSFQAQGFSSIWRSGEIVESAYLKAHFGLRREDYISAIIYVGSAIKSLPPRRDDKSEKVDFIKYWTAE